ncbi:extracellular solute-binding protein [cyanobacterium endosymbiont of Rhopalodia gibberula]|uniref:ABC transporter substrate-binding protein n=1 Tax=cyanobacterium endosymbiont of Rhopalodia gibberula TaxID=1763363 RepID=UPI000DC7417E|nr:sugar ABC transporter substrate-binding protein [cyanobacterium endosymbiont of Rhopalodia gibberula]BBA79334.1 extracellular solute-binding protein [cyanobacterium endosymbiont of Rhopalodia gibberula]
MHRFVKPRPFVLWCLLGFVVSWLISCNPGVPTASNQELEFWTMQLQPKFTPYFTEIINSFEKKNPEISVRWIDVPWEAMKSKILTTVSAKTAPDVVNLNPNFASQLASHNAWLNLKSHVPPEIQQQYLPKIWQASTLGDVSFGIPWYLTTRITLYNQELLSQANLTIPPKTFAELAEFAKIFHNETGKYAMFVTFVPGDSGEVLESLVQMGVQLVDKQRRAAFNTPEGVAAFSYWVDLYQNDLLPPEVLTQGHRHAIDLYQSGQTALLSSGAESLTSLENNAPNIAKVSAAASQITGKTGKKNVAVMNLIIPRDTNKPDDGVKFALFVTNTENQLRFAKQANVFPSTVEGVKLYIEDLKQQSESTNLMTQARKVSAMQLEDAEVLIPSMKNINKLQQIIYENLQAAMLKEKTVEQAVQDAADTWNNVASTMNNR